VTLAILLAVSVLAVSQVKREGVNGGKDKQEIKQLISMYAKAADEADPTLASHIWCNSSDESLINPVGRWHGVEQIRHFYRREMGDTYSSRNLKMSDISVQVYSDAAWQNSTGSSQPREEMKDHQFHSMALKPRFTARTTTAGIWFMFIIPRS